MNFRGLELHGKSFWSHKRIEYVLDIIRDYELNALVIHDSDFMTNFIYPSEFLNPYAPWAGAPARRGENALQNNIYYFKDLLKRAERKEIEVWIEVKELTFPDEIVEKFPELLENGVFCPTNPFWVKLLRAKYKDLVEWYPMVKGVIVSAGSPEGKAALSQKKCKCQRCASTKLSDWYLSMLNPIYEVLKPKGVKLSVREFSYTVSHQVAITEAINQMPKDVIYCIKVTPHDFYPTFPDNILIAESTGRPKWIEYDTMGQYYGWGVIPCPMFKDINDRISYALKNNVEGATLRVEWERLNDWDSLESPNRMNIFLAANACLGKPAAMDDTIRKWLSEEQVTYSEDDFACLRSYLEDSWDIVKHALYINDTVFADSSMIPMSIERAWWSMADKHSLAEWFPERKADLEMDEEKVSLYIKEKEDALNNISAWKERIDSLDHFTWITDFLKKNVLIAERYVRLHYHYGKLAILAGFIDQMKQKGLAVPQEKSADLKTAINEMEEYTTFIDQWLQASDYRHHVYLLFNPERCQLWIRGAKERLQ